MSIGIFPQQPYDPFDPKKNQPQKPVPSIDEPTPNQSDLDDDLGYDEGILNAKK